MNLTVHILAAIGALSVTSWLILAAWIWACHRARKRRRRRDAEVFAALCDAIERHPAGRAQLNDRPWDLPAPCCGGVIYGDSLKDLIANQAYHESQCSEFNRRKAA